MTEHPSLLNVPDPGHEATLAEMTGLLSCVLPPGLARLVEQLPSCQAPASTELGRTAASKGSLAAAAFLPRSSEGREGGAGLAKLLALWWEEGVEGVLGLSTSPLCRRLLSLWRLSWSLSSSLYPHLRLSAQEMIEEFSPTLSWAEAPVRCLAWHPHTTKLAVAFRDDTVRVVSGDCQATQPLLKYAGMKGVSCLAWQPCGASQLAVGCQAGVLVWTVEPGSVVSRPSSSCVTRLTGQQGPVVGVTWSPDGRLLAACSPGDGSVLVWSPASQAREQLHKVGGGGVSLVHWAPDSRRLFSGTPGSTFRVWNTADWTCDRWTVGGKEGRVAAAAWAPDGFQLLFATTDEAVLYSVSFQEGAEGAVPVMDLAQVCLPSTGQAAGGRVQDIHWDPSGHRVAVSFRSTSHILLLRSRPGPLPGRLSPVGWLAGRPGERASCLQFHLSPVSLGAILTVAWDSARLQHIPLVFGQPGTLGAQGEEWEQSSDSGSHALFSVPVEEL